MQLDKGESRGESVIKSDCILWTLRMTAGLRGLKSSSET